MPFGKNRAFLNRDGLLDVLVGGWSVSVEVINVLDTPWSAALASSQFGNSTFGQVATQGNYSRFARITARFSW